MRENHRPSLHEMRNMGVLTLPEYNALNGQYLFYDFVTEEDGLDGQPMLARRRRMAAEKVQMFFDAIDLRNRYLSWLDLVSPIWDCSDKERRYNLAAAYQIEFGKFDS